MFEVIIMTGGVVLYRRCRCRCRRRGSGSFLRFGGLCSRAWWQANLLYRIAGESGAAVDALLRVTLVVESLALRSGL